MVTFSSSVIAPVTAAAVPLPVNVPAIVEIPVPLVPPPKVPESVAVYVPLVLFVTEVSAPSVAVSDKLPLSACIRLPRWSFN